MRGSMVKAPRIQHSKQGRPPLTIDLDPGEVSRPIPAGSASPEPASSGAAEPAGAAPGAEEAVAPAAGATESGASSGKAGQTSSGATPPGGPGRPGNAGAKPGRGTAGQASQGTARLVGAGVVGGVAALILGGALQWAGILPAPAPQGADPAAVTALQGEVQALKSAVAALGTHASSADVAALKTALDQENSRAEVLSHALDGVKADVAALKSAPAPKAAADAQLQPLESRLAALEKTAKAASAGSPSAADLDAIGKRLAALEQDTRKSADAAGAATARIAALEQTVQTLSQKIAAEAGQPKIAVAIAASALKSAIDRGVPFDAELATYAAVAPPSPEIDQLRKLAAGGVPTGSELAAEVGDAADAMAAAGSPARRDGGIVRQLLASVRSLVKVRPVGDVAGTGVAATVARLEAAVKAGDLAGAVQEYDRLPAASQAAGAAFIGKVKARLEVEALVRKALAGTVKAG